MSGKIFLTSDLHLLHDREFIWKARGFNSVDEMDEEIIRRFNETVGPEDTVYILGDIALGGGSQETLEKAKSLIERLNGSLCLIRGNHDTDNRVRMYRDCKNVVSCGLWATCIKYKGYHFYLSHFPTLTANLEKESLKQTVINLCGHNHTSEWYKDMDKGVIYHCEVDAHNCYPVSINKIMEDLKTYLDKEGQIS